jgi:hypothetical protein
MTNVKTLPENEAVSNEDIGYMERREVDVYLFCLVGDKVKSWSVNTIDTGYVKTN